MKTFRILLLVLGLIYSNLCMADDSVTKRVTEFSNDKVSVWQTIIQPGKNQILSSHRHEHDRIVVAFDDGKLEIRNDKGKIHYLEMKKGRSYFLKKDIPGEFHTDENVTDHPIKVTVIELLD